MKLRVFLVSSKQIGPETWTDIWESVLVTLTEESADRLELKLKKGFVRGIEILASPGGADD